MPKQRGTRVVLAGALGCALLVAGCGGAVANPPEQGVGPPPVEREFRGVWVAAVGNYDWPSAPGLPVAEQQAELVRMLERARELRLNAVILHVRTAGDALYASELEPWSEYLTGEQGRPPEPFYDPLAFAIDEAHARGLELHAWFNPYRALHPTGSGRMAAHHISRTHPELVLRYGTHLWMDPGEDAVRERSLAVILDVLRRYDVDGIHIDDYFYPYREPGPDGQPLDFPDSASYGRYLAGGGTLARGDWRRANVDRFVREMYEAVKREKPWVKVGISPIGTWRPGVAPQLGGFDAYEQIYADSRRWLVEGWLDYFVPQLYWPIGRTDVSFPLLLDWWARQNVLGRSLWAGLAPTRVDMDVGGRGGWAPDEIPAQLHVTRGHPGSDGHVHYRISSLMGDGAFDWINGADTLSRRQVDSIRAVQRRVQLRRDTLQRKLLAETYTRPALVPTSPWLDSIPPAPPVASLSRAGGRVTVSLRPGAGKPPFLWVIQSRWPEGWRADTVPPARRSLFIATREWPEGWRTEIVPAGGRAWIIGGAAPGASAGVPGSPVEVWVSAVDRIGNQSRAVRLE
jgi:uncharacterized lipoprotein YddW (UPF0748 family)